jgi:hypothetical protein
MAADAGLWKMLLSAPTADHRGNVGTYSCDNDIFSWTNAPGDVNTLEE